jgi:alcohol dehydrogenase class IV
VIVRFGLDALPEVLGELEIKRPMLVASPRWDTLDLAVTPIVAWHEVPSERIEDAVAQAEASDGLVALGGGSAIDLGKAISAAADRPLVSIPTTYSGAEWTDFFGVRDPGRRLKGGGAGARLGGIVYEPRLTLELPLEPTVGTALNALAHCAEALYVAGRNPVGDREALEGAGRISTALPEVVLAPFDLDRRTELLQGAMHAGAALGSAGLGLGHAMAQALGGRYGLPHGALNAICLPAALRFNLLVAADEIERFGYAMKTDDPVARTEELARLGGFDRLRDLGVPEGELDDVAEAVVVRAGAKANPRPADATEVAELLRSIY